MLRFVPIDKGDNEAVITLRNYLFQEVQYAAANLLEWLQDGNWPVAHGIADYLRPHINEITDEIITILQGDDSMWKYWVLGGLISKNAIPINKALYKAIHELAVNPNPDDVESEVAEIAAEIIFQS